MAKDARNQDRDSADEKKSSRRPEKPADNRNLSAYLRIVKKVDAAGIKASKLDMKTTVFKVTASIMGTVTHTGILDHIDENFVAITCKRPRSSKIDSFTLPRNDVVSQHGLSVGKPTQVVVASNEVIMEVLGKVSFVNGAVVVKTEDGSSVEFSTSKVKLDIVKA